MFSVLVGSLGDGDSSRFLTFSVLGVYLSPSGDLRQGNLPETTPFLPPVTLDVFEVPEFETTFPPLVKFRRGRTCLGKSGLGGVPSDGRRETDWPKGRV